MSKSVVRYFPRVLRYLRPYRSLAGTSVSLTVFGALAGLLAPWPLKIIVDHVLEEHPVPGVIEFLAGPAADSRTGLLLFAVLAGLAVALVINLVDVLTNYINTKLEQHIVLDFRSDLFQHAQRLSLAFHDRRRSGMVIYAINSQGDAPAGLIMTIPMFAESVLTLVGMFYISYRMDAHLALLSLTVVPFLYYSVGYYASHIQEKLHHVKGLEGESLSIVHESISMMRVIVAFGREDHEHNRFRTHGSRAVDARVKITVRQTIFSMVVNMITAIGTAMVLGLGAYHAMQGKLTVGQLLVVLAYIAAVYKPLETISYTIGAMQDRFVNLQMAFRLLDTDPEVKDSPHARDLPHATGQLQYDNVDFHYTGREGTLKSINFTAPAGKIIGVVGQTGAGKSTLVSLLPRFYDPQHGRILLDGIDIRDIKIRSLRRQISIVLQEPLLFSGTIAENILYGRLDATPEDLVKAAEAANAHDFIMSLPQQYKTMLGERGASLSGGERQRISLARAFLKDAPILILDEPTSSVDSKTEGTILEALERLMVGRTTFLIAHRLSTIRNADHILVLNHGILAESGTEEELLQQNGIYRQLYEAQVGSVRNRVRSTAEAAADPASPS